MLFYSTEGKVKNVPFKEAVLQGFAPDGGLYLPQSLPTFSLHNLRGLSFLELSIEICLKLFKEELSSQQIIDICEEAFNFPIPFISFPNKLSVLELFHGPSLSFKDFGARFLASYLKTVCKANQQIDILVATSGDTGSAVGHAFCRIPGMRVFILFPKGKVAPSQERQLTTLGYNVKAIEIEGTFEQCQELVKQAVMDKELKKTRVVTTANSINIARLFPQALYYFYAYCQLEQEESPALFSVPCGNFGHLVSGVLAKKMGLPVLRFLAATNINDEVPLFLHSGVFKSHEAYPSMAVSMDVGNPSNFPRLLKLYDLSLEKIRLDMLGISFTDAQIIEAIETMYADYGYLLDPHSAIAYLALREYAFLENKELPRIFFATAHPAKFKESLSSCRIGKVCAPESLKQAYQKPREVTPLLPIYSLLKEQFF